MIFLNHCEDIVFQGIRVQNSPSWNIHPYFSDHLRFLDMTVLNPKDSPNTDGLDPESCRDVEIAGVYFSLGEVDLDGIMQSPIVAVGSDGQVMNPERDSAENVHPRSYGTFPRVLGRFVREKGLIPLELAVYKMSGLPAKILRLPERGRIAVGFKADITVFDPATVRDNAEYSDPKHYSTGFDYVVVNGNVVLAEGVHQKVFRGRVLTRGEQ